MDITLTQDQRKAYELLADWYHSTEKKPFFKLGGLAGTGKTSLLAYFQKTMGLSKVHYAAFTGKAAHVMCLKGMNATTLHSFLYRAHVDEKTGKVVFSKKKEEEFRGLELIVVDESSMVNKFLYEDLMALKIPIVFCGDYGQLPPVGENLGLMDENKLDAKLTQICRQDEDNGIIYYSRRVRDGYKLSYVRSKDFIFVPYDKLPLSMFIKVDQILCGYNRTRRYLNDSIRKYLLKIDEELPVMGEKLIVLDNNREYGVFNGQIIKTTKNMVVDDALKLVNSLYKSVKLTYANEYQWSEYIQRKDVVDKTILDLQNGLTKDFLSLSNTINGYENLGSFFLFPFDNPDVDVTEMPGNLRKSAIIADFAYAITCHKSQGSEWPEVLVVDEWKQRKRGDDERAKWLYTAITRASKRCIMVDDFYYD